MSDSREREGEYILRKNGDEKELRIIKWKKEKGRGDRVTRDEGRLAEKTRRVLTDEKVMMIYLWLV